MNKVLLAMFVCLFTVSALACGGSDKHEDEEDKKLFETVTKIHH